MISNYLLNWVIQGSEEDNGLSVIKNFKRLLNLGITDTSLTQQFERQPDYPSMSAIEETLKYWNVETAVLKVMEHHLPELPLPAISYLTDPDCFIIIGEFSENYVRFLDPAIGWRLQSVEEFSKRWNGIVLLADTQNAKEEDGFYELDAAAQYRMRLGIELDAVYIITLDTSEEMAHYLRQKLKRLKLSESIPVYIFEAIDGNSVDNGYLESIGGSIYPKWEIKTSNNRWWNRDMKMGEVGCSVSHYNAWRDAVTKNYNTVLILEDDFQVVYDDFSFIDNSHDWDLLYLGRNKVFSDSAVLTKNLVVPDYSYCSHAYMLKKSGIEKLLYSNFIENIIPVDEFLSLTYCDHPRRDLHGLYNLESGNLKAVSTKFSLVVQDSAKVSTTESSPYFVTKSDEGEHFMHNSMFARDESDFDRWVEEFINPMLLCGEYDLVCDEIAPNVYKVPIFNPNFCLQVIQEAENRNRWTGDRHKNYPTHDITLDKIGIDKVFSYSMNKFLMPLAMHLWHLKGDGWTNMSTDSFVAKYTLQKQSHLALHHDSSDITINICLNNEFEGGGTVFPKYKSTINLKEVGYALLHPGGVTHLHGARPITNGSRYILVSFLTRPKSNQRRN